MARNPIVFSNGTLVSNAKVNVEGTIYDVEPAQYEGTTPLSASNLNQLQTNLYDYVDAMINVLYPVGSYYETSDDSFDPNISWGGTWVLEEDGTVLVSNSRTSGSLFDNSIGTIVGEEKHTLTVNEMPSHAHQADYSSSSGVGVGVTAMGNRLGTSTLIKSAGGGQAHNIVQPSKICYRWHRTA